MENIKDLIKKIIQDNEEVYSQPCEVLEVDKETRTLKVAPLNGDADIFDVRLQAKESTGFGLVLFPSIGSQVIVSFLSKDLAFVTTTDVVEEVSLKIGEFEMFIDAENFNKSVKNIVIDNESFEQNSDTAKFTVQSLFEVESSADLKMKAINIAIEAAMIEIKGTTNITGPTTITGATNVTGPTTITGVATVAGPLAVSGAVAMGGGANGGIPKGSAISGELSKIVSEVNKIVGVLRLFTPIREDGGAALKTLANSSLNIVTLGSPSDLLNPNATH